MVLWKRLAFLYFIAVWSCIPAAFVEKRLLCSSENFNIWYTYDGPLYYLSGQISPCSFGLSLYTVNYTLIPTFTLARFGYHGIVYYNGQLWLEHTQPDLPCEDAKICYIIKGETLHETIQLYLKKFFGPPGEYEIIVTITIIDDLQGPLTLQFNITVDVKSSGSEKNIFFPQLGGL
ncbi:uncharacterized protein [Paramisgurnus dabryanus]|uniref:uncharacterized protein n=1 Tax=Paramisgurnus dabryanus TaxID=90735 RepID=UPI003CCFA0D3